MSAILDEFHRQGVDSLILDLRRNGGGSLQEAINLTGLFVGNGPVVEVKGADGNIQPYSDNGAGMAWKGPMIVLISKFSASASEILAGAIQDYGRGLIVGDHSTHGKGTVQSLMDLSETFFGLHSNTPKYGALKITMQQFFRPKGDSTQKRGVLADLELPSLTTHLDKISESDLDYAVDFAQVPAQEFHKFNDVTKPIIEKLAGLSSQRIAASSDFQKVRKDIARYEDQRKRKYVTLNEKKFLAERAEMNADKEEEKEFAASSCVSSMRRRAAPIRGCGRCPTAAPAMQRHGQAQHDHRPYARGNPSDRPQAGGRNRSADAGHRPEARLQGLEDLQRRHRKRYPSCTRTRGSRSSISIAATPMPCGNNCPLSSAACPRRSWKSCPSRSSTRRKTPPTTTKAPPMARDPAT